MRHPVLALVWECWRLSRRWYLWVLPVLFAVDYFFMGQADALVNRPGSQLSYEQVYPLLAVPALVLNFSLAAVATLLAISMGSKAGFPLAFEFRLPIQSSVLVAVPMLMLALLCASLYVLPMLLCRLLFDVPFPLLPAGALLATLGVILLTCSWATTTTRARTAAVLFGLFNSMQLFALLDPLHFPPRDLRGAPPRFSSDIFALGAGEYVALLVVVVALFGLCLSAVRKQRCGDMALAGWYSARPALQPAAPSMFAKLLNRAADMLSLPCPVGAAWRAELWLELKRHGMPVLVLSGIVALATPLLFAVGISPPATIDSMDYALPLVVFLGAVGIAIFNRRLATAGYMSAFEGTRGMSTTSLALLQTLALAAAIMGGILLVSISVHFSAEMLDVSGAFARRLQALVAGDGAASTLQLVSAAVMQLTILFSAIALFTCVHAGAVVWGRVLPYGAGIVAIYGLIFASRVSAGSAQLEEIQQHMWGFAAVVLLLTLAAIGRTLYLRILSWRAGLATLAGWILFAVCSLYTLARQDIVLTSQAPELQAFNAALLLLPLTLCVLLFWAYDRLRHR